MLRYHSNLRVQNVIQLTKVTSHMAFVFHYYRIRLKREWVLCKKDYDTVLVSKMFMSILILNWKILFYSVQQITHTLFRTMVLI